MKQDTIDQVKQNQLNLSANSVKRRFIDHSIIKPANLTTSTLNNSLNNAQVL